MKAPSQHRARRANTDDLPQLLTLWREAQFDVEALEKRFTEFHVAADEVNQVAATVRLQMHRGHGVLHSETFSDFALTDRLRPLLWEHLQVVARHYGLHILWTRESAPFWRKDAGFAEATAEWLAKLPAELGAASPGWLALRLREEEAEPEALARQLELLMITEREKREKIFRRARALRVTGTLLAVALFVFGILVLVYYFRLTHH